ncbi:hypothetical protein SLE2022_290320 [Rubroshorea leprosula]|uniref:BHLH domain-containing protein n=1 Tax=Rubroshorea leprosula TaxID=152421 RepID=A0AAV5KUB3_9ROSI|nr:hypothetical protein SLEP1_g37142 [Rubroshorea leprosula]
MSNHRSRASKITEEQLNDLILKLQTLLPQLNQGSNSRVSVSRVLKETCNHIRRLQREVDDLSDRLSQLLASVDTDGVEAEILRNLLQQ